MLRPLLAGRLSTITCLGEGAIQGDWLVGFTMQEGELGKT